MSMKALNFRDLRWLIIPMTGYRVRNHLRFLVVMRKGDGWKNCERWAAARASVDVLRKGQGQYEEELG